MTSVRSEPIWLLGTPYALSFLGDQFHSVASTVPVSQRSVMIIFLPSRLAQRLSLPKKSSV